MQTVNKHGFFKAPYPKVITEKAKSKLRMIVYLSADEDEDYKSPCRYWKLTTKVLFDQWVAMRYMNKFIEGPVEDVQYIDVLPQQVVGTSGLTDSFIAHDEKSGPDGYHMQCQAVPLIKPQAPIIWKPVWSNQ